MKSGRGDHQQRSTYHEPRGHSLSIASECQIRGAVYSKIKNRDDSRQIN